MTPTFPNGLRSQIPQQTKRTFDSRIEVGEDASLVKKGTGMNLLVILLYEQPQPTPASIGNTCLKLISYSVFTVRWLCYLFWTPYIPSSKPGQVNFRPLVLYSILNQNRFACWPLWPSSTDMKPHKYALEVTLFFSVCIWSADSQGWLINENKTFYEAFHRPSTETITWRSIWFLCLAVTNKLNGKCGGDKRGNSGNSDHLTKAIEQLFSGLDSWYTPKIRCVLSLQWPIVKKQYLGFILTYDGFVNPAPGRSFSLVISFGTDWLKE